MRKPDPKLRQARRTQIINSAAELFARTNFHKVLMADVARKAGVAKGTLYNYFPDKETLYFAIIRDRLSRLLYLLQERVEQHRHPVINLRRIIVHMYHFLVKYPYFFEIWYGEKAKIQRQNRNELCSTHREIRKLLRETIREGKAQNYFREIEEEWVTDIILGMIDSAVLRKHGRSSGNGLADQNQEDIRLFKLVLTAVGKRRALNFHAQKLDEPELSRRFNKKEKEAVNG